jgi:hypothetical protein
MCTLNDSILSDGLEVYLVIYFTYLKEGFSRPRVIGHLINENKFLHLPFELG